MGVDFRAVLAELKAERERLDFAISAMEALAGRAGCSADPDRWPAGKGRKRGRRAPLALGEVGVKEEGAPECPLCQGGMKKAAVCKHCDVRACKKCVKYGSCSYCRSRHVEKASETKKEFA